MYSQHNIYRPQRSCEGYVFTGVCLSTGGCLPQCMVGYTHPPPEQTPPEQTPPPSRHPRADTPQSRHPPGADPPSRHPPPPEIRPLLRTVRILLECILVCDQY